jgi:polysaccharide biosynthesis/export protein
VEAVFPAQASFTLRWENPSISVCAAVDNGERGLLPRRRKDGKTMDPGQAGTGWRKYLPLGLIVVALTGCAGAGAHIDRALLSKYAESSHSIPLDKFYQVHCPDELAIRIPGRHSWQGTCVIGPDGRIVLGNLGTLRADGMTPAEVAERLGKQLGLPAEQVEVAVTAYKSQQVFVYGEVEGLQRAVEYHGPETVVELLQRVGGLTTGAAPGDVQVVRMHVADGKQPEIFHIDLPAILLKQEPQSNIRVQPLDQIYIGQTKQCYMAKCLPAWFRPLFEGLCGMKSQPRNQASPDSAPGA